MHSEVSDFDPGQIVALLKKKGIDWIDAPDCFASIASTSDYLMQLPGSVHGRLCIADFQTGGRGRLGRQWFASRGSNLMFSLGWRPAGPPCSEVSLLVGVALADALNKLGLEDFGLKWPNDLIYRGRKLAGILVESRFRGTQAELVIGVGLNLHHRESDMQGVEQPWVDFTRLGVEQPDRQQLLVIILTELAGRLAQFETQGFAPIRRDWLHYHLYQGEEMQYQHDGKTRSGRVAGLDHQGALLIESDGTLVAVRSGEVSSLRVVA